MFIRSLSMGLICLVLFSYPAVAKAEEVNVLVLGQYQGQYETMMVNTYEKGADYTQIISIPPGSVFTDGTDLLQRKPIHQLLAEKGVNSVREALADYLQLPIPHYVIIDYEGAQAVVDALGGVEFMIPYPIELPATEEEPAILLKEGLQELDGMRARRLLRYRGHADIEGPEELAVIELQQRFLHAMIDQLAKNKWKIVPLALKLPKMIKTNIGVFKFLDLALMAVSKDLSELELDFGIVPGEFVLIGEGYQYRIQEAQGYRPLDK